MKNKLKQAVEAADVPQVRAILIDIIRKDSGKAVPIDSVTEAIEKTPGLFQKDDGKYYAASPADMTETLINSLESDLENNFSLEKFRLLTEVYAFKAEKPHYFSDREGSRGDSDSSATTAPYNSYAVPITDSSDTPRRTSVGRTIGFIVMIAGLAAAIVGLCVPVRLLVGLGIGVFMLGSALVYAAINRNKEY